MGRKWAVAFTNKLWDVAWGQRGRRNAMLHKDQGKEHQEEGLFLDAEILQEFFISPFNLHHKFSSAFALTQRMYSARVWNSAEAGCLVSQQSEIEWNNIVNNAYVERDYLYSTGYRWEVRGNLSRRSCAQVKRTEKPTV